MFVWIGKHIVSAAASAALVLTGITAASSAQATPIRLADILSTDPLGYECVQSAYLEESDDGTAAIAFSLSGKTRLPRTCLPEPCARALTPTELSALTGTEMILAKFYNEWDEYYARYSEFCRKEVVAFGYSVEQPPITKSTFWPPILRKTPTPKTPRPKTSPQCFFCDPIPVPDPPRDPPLSNKTKSIFEMTSAGGEGGYSPPPSPVPLPNSGTLLAAALALFVWRRPRNRSGKTGAST